MRKVGIRRILKARELNQNKTDIRKLKVPEVNLDASDYSDLITWQDVQLTEPPILSSVPTLTLRELVNKLVTPKSHIPKFKCHTQPVERVVKMVTEASKACYVADSKEGYILSKIKSRRIMPAFECKSQYRTNDQ